MNRLIRPAVAAALVLGVSLIITPFGNPLYIGALLVPALTLAGFALFIAVSVLTTRAVSPAGSPVGESGLSRPGPDAAGVLASPAAPAAP